MVGRTATVHAVRGGYPLPDGLDEGAEVLLLAFDHGYWRVWRKGREWKVVSQGVRLVDRPERTPLPDLGPPGWDLPPW